MSGRSRKCCTGSKRRSSDSSPASKQGSSRVVASAGLAAKILCRTGAILCRTGAIPWRITAYDDVSYMPVFREFFRTPPCYGSPTIRVHQLTIQLQQPEPGHGRRLRRRRNRLKAFGAIWPPAIMSTRGLAAAAGAKAAPPTTSTSPLPTVPRLKPKRAVSCFLGRGTRPSWNSTDNGRRLSVGFGCALAGTLPGPSCGFLPASRKRERTKRCPAGRHAVRHYSTVAVSGGVRCAGHSRSRQ